MLESCAIQRKPPTVGELMPRRTEGLTTFDRPHKPGDGRWTTLVGWCHEAPEFGVLLPHRQVLNAIDKIARETSLGHKLQFLDELADRKLELGSVDNTRKVDALSLPSRGF
jgi:hypothetical protein